MADEETMQAGTAVEEAVEEKERIEEAPPEAEVRPEEEFVAERVPTKEEKFLAALAHFCIVAVLPVVQVPLLIWLIEKDKPGKSEYLLHHARQALLYQVLLLGTVIVLLATVVLAPLGFLLGLAGIVYGVVGGILACTGKKFNYLWIGNYVKQWSQ